MPAGRSRLTSSFWHTASENLILSWLYSIGHNTILKNDRLARIASYIFRSAAGSLRKRYENHRTCAVVALHPGAAVALAEWKKHSDFLFYAVCTDLFVHGMQANEMVDVVFADKRSLIYGSAAKDAAKTGKIEWGDLPIDEKFFQEKRLCEPEASRVVVTFGAKSIRWAQNIEKIVSLVQSARGHNFDIVCGNNSDFRNTLEQRIQFTACGKRVRVHGYVDDMHSLYRQSAAVIGKPGGLTVAEVTAMGLPFGILDWLPGQEERNIESLTNNPLVAKIRNHADLMELMKKKSATFVEIREQRHSSHALRGSAAIAQSISANLASREQVQRCC